MSFFLFLFFFFFFSHWYVIFILKWLKWPLILYTMSCCCKPFSQLQHGFQMKAVLLFAKRLATGWPAVSNAYGRCLPSPLYLSQRKTLEEAGSSAIKSNGDFCPKETGEAYTTKMCQLKNWRKAFHEVEIIYTKLCFSYVVSLYNGISARASLVLDKLLYITVNERIWRCSEDICLW